MLVRVGLMLHIQNYDNVNTLISGMYLIWNAGQSQVKAPYQSLS